jgi:imidazolonepropionase
VSVAHVARRVVTCDPALATPGDPLSAIEDGAVVVDGATVSWVGRAVDVPPGVTVVDHGGRTITPGLVDAHTHSCWVGSRHAEYAVRMAGGDYEAIAEAGGGILSTYRAVASSSVEELASALEARLRRMAAMGVTTVEVKSGYGLEQEHEMKQLAAIRAVSGDPSLPRVVATFLALHALPPAAGGDRERYVREVAEERVPEVAERELAEFVDAYVDRQAFQLAEARLVFESARRMGLGVRVHAGQFADIGGAELAAELGASSVDHLENVAAAGIAALAASGAHAVLLPVASFTLAQASPPVRALRDAGVPLVVASDANPGTAPTESLPLALAFAVRSYGLTPQEALLAATRHAAASLRRDFTGVLAAKRAADLVVWDLPHEVAIVQPWGVSRARLVLRDGRAIHGDGPT